MIDRTAFAAARGVDLDPFQLHACDALDRGHSVLVAAPTGSGKTLVAEYAIEAALERNEKAFYTTPLKALSNQKFTDFAARDGRARVGLLTGDNTINGEAPVVVMTTEVLRNMIYAESPTLDGLGIVVLDEVHYLQDRFRGPVWEEVIVHLDHTVPLVCLSATVSNAIDVAEWIATVRGPTEPVVEERRPVALRDLYLVGERGRDGLTLPPTFVGAPSSPKKAGQSGRRPNPEAQRLGRTGPREARPRARGRLRTPTRDEVVELLEREAMLPAIVFVFSRAGCDQAVEHARAAAVRLTTPDERERIRAIAEAHTASLADDELEVLGYTAWLDALEAGIAAHHAGLVPPLKEAVEEAFTAGLVKVVYATETLALGVNMPARTVVIEKLTKFTGERHEFLTAGEYTQLTGRAGRRGIDELGFAIVCWSPFVTFDQVASLAGRGSDPLVSAFRPTYNMAANLVARYDRDTAHRLLNSSFAQFRADRDVVSLERELSRAIARRDRLRGAHEESDDPPRDPRPPATDRRAVERALDRLQPGDVVLVGRRNTRMVVIAHAGRARGGGAKGGRVLAVDPGRDVRRLGPDDFGAPPEAVARVELPDPYAPRSPAFRRMVADAGRRAKLRTGNGDGTPSPREADRDRTTDRRAAGASALGRQEREVQRLERRVRARSESLARQFDRVLGLLESWGYVEEWALTDAGRLLARLSHECDLLLAEAVRDRVFDDLSAPELAAVVSCFTYERRGPDDTRSAHVRWPSNKVSAAVRAIERRWHDLNAAEDDHRLPATRPVDPGFVEAMFEWARGDALALVLDDEVSAGDFVRQVKQCIDVLRQIGDVEPDPAVAATARDAARRVPAGRRRGGERSRWGRRMIRKGEPWGEPFDGERYPDAVEAGGGDVELAAVVAAHPGTPIRFAPTRASDSPRALGLRDPPTGNTVLACDAIELPDGSPAVNAVVFGIPPDRQQWWQRRGRAEVEVDGRRVADRRALCVVVANGQYLRGFDVVPRGHPGDGRFEVHVYALEPREPGPMQHRLTAGRHLPHPNIIESSGREVTVRFDQAVPWEADGRPRGTLSEATLRLVPGVVNIIV